MFKILGEDKVMVEKLTPERLQAEFSLGPDAPQVGVECRETSLLVQLVMSKSAGTRHTAVPARRSLLGWSSSCKNIASAL
jgi:hypothetical protein